MAAARQFRPGAAKPPPTTDEKQNGPSGARYRLRHQRERHARSEEIDRPGGGGQRILEGECSFDARLSHKVVSWGALTSLLCLGAAHLRPVRSPSPLDGHGVRLRPWRVADAATVEAIRIDPVVSRWSGLAAEDAAAWIARQIDRADGVSLAVTEPPSETALGKAAIRCDRGAGTAELSYWLIGPARGRGLAVAACRTLCEWGFTAAGLVAIVLDIEVDNEASLGVARALGASPAPGLPRVELDRGGIPRRLVAHVFRRE